MIQQAEHETGVIIADGPQDWQILQQDGSGRTLIRLAGRWSTAEPFRTARVVVRLIDEARMQPVTRVFDWRPAHTERAGTWSATLRQVPAGGLYRIETGLQLDGGPVEWARRGDMRHHIGVGDLWVIAGQSNAAGYGKAPCYDPPVLGVHCFHACGEWRLATHPFSDSTGTQYPANREAANGSHSPFLAFGRRLLQTLGHPIGLIPAALGGSPLVRWVRGDNGDLFQNMLAYLRDAGGACRGMVWIQGESDTAPEQRSVYARRFTRMVADFRKTQRSPRLPIITAQINRYIGEPYDRPVHDGWEVIRESQRQIARDLPDVAVVSTLDLALSDGIHNDSRGNLTLGERMADAALGMAYGRDVKWRCPDVSRVRRLRASVIELTFDHVETRLHFENNIPEQFPFAVRDPSGNVPVKGWRFTAKNRLRLELARPLRGEASVTGAPTACPPGVIPLDLCGYRPMLGFTCLV